MPGLRRRRGRAAHPQGDPVEWVGGRSVLPMYITEGRPYRPEAVLWLELPSRLVVGFTLIDPQRPIRFADTLRDAMRAPHAGRPRRPPRVRVADEALAAEVRAALAGTSSEETTEIVVAPTPEIDEVVRLFAESFPEGDEPLSYLEGGRVPADAVRELFAAAATLYRAAPWQAANDGQVLRLDVPALGIAGAALSIIGALGESLGFLVFPSLAAYDAFAEAGERAMRRRRPSAARDLGTGFLALNFYRAAELPPAMRDEVRQHRWPIASPQAYPRVEQRERDGLPRPLAEPDVRLATACANALTSFVAKHEALFRGTSVAPVSESYGGEGLTVRLTAPYQAFDLFDDIDDEDLGPGGFSVPFKRSAPGFEGGLLAPETGRRGRTGRNDPCPCGSGKKYKRCHLEQDEAGSAASAGSTAPLETAGLHALDGRLAEAMATYVGETLGSELLRSETVVSDPMTAGQLWVPWSLYHRRVGGRALAEHFLAERGDRLTSEEREWIGAQSRSWLGIWEVEDAEPGDWIELHDLLTGEHRRVIEASASRVATRRAAVLGRVVDHAGLSVLCGVHPRPLLPLEAADVAQVFRARLRRRRAAPVEQLREERLGRDLIARWEEAVALLDERSRTPPRVHNQDGDELVFISERHDFDPAARSAIEARLAALPGIVPPEDDDADRQYVFHRQERAGGPASGDLVVGAVRVGEAHLSLETNSVARADALRTRVEAALGDLVRRRRRRRRDAQRMVERAWEREPSRGDRESRTSDLATPGAQQLLREMKERHYADWPDQPLPALDGKTAREAVRTRSGRERVDALLKHIEYGEASLPIGERFDVSALRHALRL